MAQTPTLYWAQFETPNFNFAAFGTTPAAADKALATAWAQHAKTTGADPSYLTENAVEVRVRPVVVGDGFRDDELLVWIASGRKQTLNA
jgi:hypothetical protein